MDSTNANPWRAVNLWMLAAFGLPFIVYGQTFLFDFVNYDDNVYVYDNSMVLNGLSFEGIRWAFTYPYVGNYHPLTWVSHMLDVEWLGESARGHHIVNTFLHAVNGVLLFLLLRNWTGALAKSGVVALLFAVHPLHVESVAWISERKVLLSTFFMFVTLGMYTQYVRTPSRRRYVLIMVAYAAGLLSNPALATLPLVLIFLDYWPLGRIRTHEAHRTGSNSIVKLLVEKLPLLVLSAASCVVTVIAKDRAGMILVESAYPIGIRWTNAAIVCVGYVLQTVWPAKLTPFYPHHGNAPPIWQWGGAIMCVLMVSIWAYRTRRTHPYVAFGWLWYLVTLLPVIGMSQVGMQAHADRDTYVPLVGIFIIAVWGAPVIAARLRLNPRILTGLTTASIALFVLMAYVQTGHWRNSETLWRYTIKVAPDNVIAHQNLGVHYLSVANDLGAEAAFQRTLELSATDPYMQVFVNGAALNSLGGIAERRLDMNQAAEYYARAVDWYPGSADIRTNLGEVLLAVGELDQAELELGRALQLDPELARAWNSLAFALILQGRPDQALKAGSHAIALVPGNAEFRYHMALAEFTEKRYDRSLRHINKTLAIDSGFEPALNLRTMILARQGKQTSDITTPVER